MFIPIGMKILWIVLIHCAVSATKVVLEFFFTHPKCQTLRQPWQTKSSSPTKPSVSVPQNLRQSSQTLSIPLYLLNLILNLNLTLKPKILLMLAGLPRVSDSGKGSTLVLQLGNLTSRATLG